jgi:hypothetical protein
MKLWPLVPWLLTACTHPNWKHTAPHNFPPVHEWNAPLETSWVNAVDMYRRLATPTSSNSGLGSLPASPLSHLYPEFPSVPTLAHDSHSRTPDSF